jgi:hypothetical protein
MITMESSTIQAKESDRAMIREAMSNYTGPINIVTPPPGTNALAEWRGVNQIALPGSSIRSKTENEVLAKVGRISELVSLGANNAAIAKALKMRVAGVVNLAKAHGVALNG